MVMEQKFRGYIKQLNVLKRKFGIRRVKAVGALTQVVTFTTEFREGDVVYWANIHFAIVTTHNRFKPLLRISKLIGARTAEQRDEYVDKLLQAVLKRKV